MGCLTAANSPSELSRTLIAAEATRDPLNRCCEPFSGRYFPMRVIIIVDIMTTALAIDDGSEKTF